MSKKIDGKEFLFVSHKYPPSTGGMQKQSYELIRNAESYQKTHKLVFTSSYPKIFFFLSVTIRTFLKVLLNRKIKLVHANDGLMALFLTPLLFFNKRLKLGATIHGLDVVINFSPYQWWVRKFLAKFDFLVAVSEATKEECVKAGIPISKVHFIPNAVELPDKVDIDPTFSDWMKEHYQVALEEHFIISSVGRPVPRKGFGWFAGHVLPQLENTKYLVVGTEIENSWVINLMKRVLPPSGFEKACKMLGVPLDNIRLAEIARKNNNLVLLGKIPWDKLIQTYLHTDIFVMPNLRIKGDFEGFGLVALEAGSLGALCLAANVDGIPSAIKDGENGILLESDNPGLWASKIEELQQKETLIHYKKKFEKYFNGKQITWQEMSAEYITLFNSYVDQGSSPG